MADMVQIKNTNLDSNNWVNCFGVTFTPAYKKLVNTNPLNGQFSGTAYLIAQADKVGVENPVFTIRGQLNTNDYSTAADIWDGNPSGVSSTSEDGTSMTNAVTLAYLMNLWRDMTGTTVLKISFGDPSGQVNWKNYDFSSDELTVEIIGINFNPRQDTVGNHFIDYTINCREVRA